MEASRKGLNALRNSNFPQICELVARNVRAGPVMFCQGLDKQMIAEQRRLRLFEIGSRTVYWS